MRWFREEMAVVGFQPNPKRRLLSVLSPQSEIKHGCDYVLSLDSTWHLDKLRIRLTVAL